MEYCQPGSDTKSVITIIVLPKIHLEQLELLRPWGLRSSSLEAPGLNDTNLNTLSIQTHCIAQAGAKNWLDILKKSSKS